MTECGLCGAAMTGAECRVCGWRPSTVTAPPPPAGGPAVSAPAAPPTPVPGSGSAGAARLHASGRSDASAGGTNRTIWVLGGLVAAAVVIGAIAVSTSGGGKSSAPPSVAGQPTTGARSGSDTTPNGDGADPSGDEGSTPDTPKLTGAWITVLESIPQYDGGLDRARSIANDLQRRYGVGLYVIDSGRYKGLNPGWWAVVMTGFDSNAEARAACSSVGRSPSGSCYGRRVKG